MAGECDSVPVRCTGSAQTEMSFEQRIRVELSCIAGRGQGSSKGRKAGEGSVANRIDDSCIGSCTLTLAADVGKGMIGGRYAEETSRGRKR
jgi:hypothetical protein